jgi:AcrR family transcriptional regulator
MKDQGQDGLRERKKRETRQHISDVATRLFSERGFDNVTVAEVAEAANVSKMTVFNYFPRKEDLFFDLEDEWRTGIARAIRERPPDESPVAALRRFMRELTLDGNPMSGVSAGVPWFWAIVEKSAALRGRLREMDEALQLHLAELFAETTGAPARDPTAQMAAGMAFAVHRTLYNEARRRLSTGEAVESVRKGHLAMIERGFELLEKALAETPYGSVTPKKEKTKLASAKKRK